jgi:hypothetical protein
MFNISINKLSDDIINEGTEVSTRIMIKVKG